MLMDEMDLILLHSQYHFLWISNYTSYNVLHEITYPFPNYNSWAIEVWEWVSNFIPQLLGMWLLIHAGINVKPC